jgi:cathepsin B
VKVKKYDKKELADLPKSFDAREKWPNCKYIGHLRSQGICGSCWAMGSTEAMTDRICIHSNGKDQAYLSSEHVVSCAVINGCSGGEIENVYDFYKKKGIVTGGDYDSSEGCWPYPFEPTEPKLFHTNRNRHRLPNDEDPPTPECVNECPNKGYKIKFEDDKHKGQEYHTFKTVEDIQKEILENGPVAASFTVYDDFSCK